MFAFFFVNRCGRGRPHSAFTQTLKKIETIWRLAEETLGYDTAPIEGFDAAGVKRECGIPDEANVIALLAIGHLKEPDKKYPGRLPTEKIAFEENTAGRGIGTEND